MAGTYWLTILPETSRLRAGIKQAVREAERGLNVSVGIKENPERQGRDYSDRFSKAAQAKVKPGVDNRDVPEGGRDGGRKYSRGFNETGRVRPNINDRDSYARGRKAGDEYSRGFSSRAKAFATLGGIGLGLKFAGIQMRKLFSLSVGPFSALEALFATTKLAGFALTGLAAKLMKSGSLLKYLGGAALLPLASSLGFIGKKAGQVANQFSKVAAAALVVSKGVQFLGFMAKAAKVMAVLTIGSVLAAGAMSALSVTISAAVTPAVIALGSAIGVFAGAALGLLGPALFVAKMGFAGMGDAAKQFNKDFKDADEAFNTMIGQRMGPMLTAFRSLKQSITDTFSSTLVPAFASLGTFMDGMKPRAGALAVVMGKVGNELTNALNGPTMTKAFDQMFAGSNKFFSSFLGESGLTGLMTGVAEFAATAATTFSGFGGTLNEAFLKAGDWLRNISPLQMQAAFQNLKQIIENVSSVLKPIMSTIRELGAISAPALAPGFKALGAAISEAKPGFMAMAKDLMPALGRVMQNLAPILPALVQAFGPTAKILAVLAPALASVITALAPFAPLILGAALAWKTFTVAFIAYQSATLAWNVAQKAVTVGMWLLNAAMAANPIVLIVAAVVALGVALWAFFTKTEVGRKMWAVIWDSIKTVAGAVFDFLKEALQFVGDKISWLWQNVAVPAFEGIKGAIETMWNAAKVVWDVFQTTLETVGNKVVAFKDTLSNAFKTVKDVVQSVWNAIGGIIDKIGNGVGRVADFLRGAGGSVLNAVGLGGAATGGMILSRYEGGGRISGPGSGRSDSILGFPAMVRVSNGEYVVNAKSTARYLPLLQAINAGRIPGFADGGSALGPPVEMGGSASTNIFGAIAKMLWNGSTMTGQDSAMAFNAGPVSRRKFADGGQVSLGNISGAGITTSEQQSMWDAVRSRFPNAVLSSATREVMTEGHPDFHNSGMAIDISGSGMSSIASWIASNYPNSRELIYSPFNSNIKDGRNVGDGTSFYGAGTMAGHRDHIHWALGGMADSPASSVGSTYSASSSGGTYRAATSAELLASSNRVSSAGNAVTQAQQRVDDRTYSVGKAERRIAELNANPDAKQSQKDDADRALEVANRELADANNNLAEKRDKAAEVEQADLDLRTNGKLDTRASASASTVSESGGSDGSSLGQTFVSGILESFGLDGSLFSNPLEWPSVKSLMAGVNFAGGLLSQATGVGGEAGAGGFAGGVADAVGLGGMLSAIPGLSPGGVNPAVAGTDLMVATAGAPAAHSGSGAAPGPVDNSINFNGNVGMAPADVQTKVTQMQTDRTRTTKVN